MTFTLTLATVMQVIVKTIQAYQKMQQKRPAIVKVIWTEDNEKDWTPAQFQL